MRDGDGPGPTEELPDPREGPGAAIRWLRHTDDEWVSFGRELLKSVLFVAVVGLLLFAVSGVWPPMVAVESGSMEPHMYRGDLVFVAEEHRYTGGNTVPGTGVVPYQRGRETNYREFGGYGDVIVFHDPAERGPPIIHRARFWVSDGENWVREANPAYLPADSCDAVANCPAPHAGFITKGDANPYYDQAERLARPVKPDWIRGRAMFRLPWIGYVRLLVSGAVLSVPGLGAAAAGAGAAVAVGR